METVAFFFYVQNQVKMKIAFDGQIFLSGEKTGVAWVGYKLLDSLENAQGNICQINVLKRKLNRGSLRDLEHFQKKGFAIRHPVLSNSVLCKTYMFFRLFYSALFGSDADVTVFFNFIVPQGVKGRKIVFIHDMAYRAYPKTVRFRTKMNLILNMNRTIKRADHIVTVSEFSRSEIMKYLRIPKKNITVIPCGVDHAVFRPGYPKRQVDRVREKYGIDGDYLLYLGTIEPRKNLERLVVAYQRLLYRMPNAPLLLLAGGKGWKSRSIYAAASKRMLKGKIRFLGYVENADRPLLLNGAMAFVFPSLYEGFGMPPLEAMACGTPVITSDSASLPEVAGDAAIKVDPMRTDEIAEAMYRICKDEDFRKRLSESGLRRAEKYTWKRAACRLQKTINKIAEKD